MLGMQNMHNHIYMIIHVLRIRNITKLKVEHSR